MSTLRRIAVENIKGRMYSKLSSVQPDEADWDKLEARLLEATTLGQLMTIGCEMGATPDEMFAVFFGALIIGFREDEDLEFPAMAWKDDIEVKPPSPEQMDAIEASLASGGDGWAEE
jgi:hypothetical protein